MAHREREARLLGTLIRPARQRMGWTQAQLAERLGIDKGYVSAIETGVRRWPLEHVRAIAEILGLDVVEMAVAAEMIPGYRRTGKTTHDDFPPEDPMQELLTVMADADFGERQGVLDFARFQRQAHDEVRGVPEPTRIERRARAMTPTEGE